MKRLQALQPHLIAFAVFALVAYIYTQPSFNHKTISATDIVQYAAMTHGNHISQEKTGVAPKWNRHMFSGMPFYFENIEGAPIAGVIHRIIYKIFNIQFLYTFDKTYFAYFFVACISFYFLTQITGIQYLIGILFALAFAYGTNIPILIIAGHHTKIFSIALMPYVLGCALLIFKKRYWTGLCLGILSAAALFSYGHYQIILYTLFALTFLSIAYAVYLIREKEKNYKHLLLSLGLVGGIILISALKNIPSFLATKDYAEVSTRSGSALVNTREKQENQPEKTTKKTDKGVGKDYAFQWSYMPSETLTVFAPSMYGAASYGILNEQSLIYKELQKLGADPATSLQIAQRTDTYWGEQPFTLGPVYYGVIVGFLFLFALYFYRSWLLWGLVSLTLFSFFIAWGKYFPLFNEFMYDYFPYYNKFRTPSMILCLPQITFPLLAALGLQQFLFTPRFPDKIKSAFKKTLYTAIGLLSVLTLAYWTMSYSGRGDADSQSLFQQISGNNTDIVQKMMGLLRADRQRLFQGDLLKILLLLGSFTLLCLAYYYEKIKKQGFIALTALLLLGDLFFEDVRYLSHASYKTAQEDNAYDDTRHFPLREADKFILQDKDPNYRVLDLSTGNPYTNANLSFYHRSIGGYYAAKLALYQDLIDSQLSLSKMMNPKVLAMLNTRYVIYHQQEEKELSIQKLPALGACWFVTEARSVPDTYEEMRALSDFDPKNTAIIEAAFQSLYPAHWTHDPQAQIKSTYTANDTMRYESESRQQELAVFSEIYCNKGWKAFIDGKQASIIKANYALRALVLPAGKHHIEFIFAPDIFKKTKTTETILAIIILLICLITLYVERKNILRFVGPDKKRL